ncbi:MULTISPECIES: hypothetical protein [Bacillus]|uniref:Uncharacterized protein n=2 Tax=Bacillus TaxID=1386 RepID=A0A0M4FLC8_9BACI|nr:MULTISPECIES: hypothetical protein [Bacillus]ALC82804.1 hypothetical protein AM592_15335 [Bacillus gobiensis]MBP1081766.1 hypothetical protein [Bacillus capparidis]MED1096417.1 hypothetical protein [Bacillus capparidis]
MKNLIESMIISIELIIGWVFLINMPVYQLTGGSLIVINRKMDEPKQLLQKKKRKTTGNKQKAERAFFQSNLQNGIKESPCKVRAGPVFWNTFIIRKEEDAYKNIKAIGKIHQKKILKTSNVRVAPT